MKKEIPLPLYIKERDGSYMPISVATGVLSDRDCYSSPSIGTFCAMFPEYTITREEFNKQISDNVKKRYEDNFKPIVDAFKVHGKLTPQKLSKIIKTSEKEAKKTLERLCKVDWVERDNGSYTMPDEKADNMRRAFGIK
jgi:hypothetical protein